MDEKTAVFRTPSAPAEALVKERGSRFLAFLYPVESEQAVRLHLARLRELHPKATHHCYAWRLGPAGVLHRLNDDGEPGGSAARPMFNVLLAEGLTDVLAVVVRYFGGTKLGVPGLIAAYKAAVQAAVQAAVVIEKTRETAFLLRFPYACLNEVMRRLKAAALQPTDLLREATCTLRVNVPVPEVAAFLNRCREVYELEIIEE